MRIKYPSVNMVIFITIGNIVPVVPQDIRYTPPSGLNIRATVEYKLTGKIYNVDLLSKYIYIPSPQGIMPGIRSMRFSTKIFAHLSKSELLYFNNFSYCLICSKTKRSLEKRIGPSLKTDLDLIP